MLFQQRSMWSVMAFPVVMYGCESWTIKKAKCWRIDAFELWCWIRLESLLDCKEIKPVNPEGNQSWHLTGRTDAEAAILWPLDVKSWLIGEDLDAGKIEGRRRRGRQRLSWLVPLDHHSMEMNLNKLLEMVKDREAWRTMVHGITKSWTQLSSWTITITSVYQTEV